MMTVLIAFCYGMLAGAFSLGLRCYSILVAGLHRWAGRLVRRTWLYQYMYVCSSSFVKRTDCTKKIAKDEYA